MRPTTSRWGGDLMSPPHRRHPVRHPSPNATLQCFSYKTTPSRSDLLRSSTFVALTVARAAGSAVSVWGWREIVATLPRSRSTFRMDDASDIFLSLLADENGMTTLADVLQVPQPPPVQQLPLATALQQAPAVSEVPDGAASSSADGRPWYFRLRDEPPPQWNSQWSNDPVKSAQYMQQFIAWFHFWRPADGTMSKIPEQHPPEDTKGYRAWKKSVMHLRKNGLVELKKSDQNFQAVLDHQLESSPTAAVAPLALPALLLPPAEAQEAAAELSPPQAASGVTAAVALLPAADGSEQTTGYAELDRTAATSRGLF